MDNKISYRYNVMRINSIDSFASISGGFNNNVRDVYFVRAIGETQTFVSDIKKLDEKLCAEMTNGRLRYIRIKKLPIIKDVEQSSYYSGMYDRWKNGGILKLRNIINSQNFYDALSSACRTVMERYKENQKVPTDSMIRNFATKLLFWIDSVGKDILNEWKEKCKIKVVAENIVKDQEFLFYYCLTMLGCDVLFLENKCDVNVPDSWKNITQEIKLGNFGVTDLEEFNINNVKKKNESVTEHNMNVPRDLNAADEETGNDPIRITIPKHHERKQTNLSMDTGKVSSATNNTRITHQPSATNTQQISPARESRTLGYTEASSLVSREKSFEELAQLASSIVLIGVHDPDGSINGTGSGIMIGRDGYILTNYHVIEAGRFFSVRIEEDDKVYATSDVIKYNEILDLAIIRIKRRLSPLPLYRGTKKLVRGQKVVAIGSPLGLFNSVSDGIISGFRNIKDVDMIQFTAPISHGSSGGAVLNMHGEVIGISTAGIDSGQNINLAIGYESIRMFAKGIVM